MTGVPGPPRRAERIAAVMSNQDAINKYRADALVASEFAAFRQRWAIGIDIPVDPETGRPSSPSSRPWTGCGRSRVRTPRTPTRRSRRWASSRPRTSEPYKLMIETEVGHISRSASRTTSSSASRRRSAVGRVAEVVGGRPGAQGRAHRAPPRRGLGGGHAPVPAGHGRRPGTHPLRRDHLARPRDPERGGPHGRRAQAVPGGVIDLETAQEQLGYSPEQVRQMRERREPAAHAACARPRHVHPDRRRLHRRRHQHRQEVP